MGPYAAIRKRFTPEVLLLNGILLLTGIGKEKIVEEIKTLLKK